MIPLARKTLVYEWRRYLPALMSISFSGILLLVQSALVYGIFGASAVNITRSSADLWVGHSGTQSFDLGRDIPDGTDAKVMITPEIARVEKFYWTSGEWLTRGRGSSVSVLVSGIDPSSNGMALDRALSPTLRQRLYEFGAIIVDQNDLKKLGLSKGEHGQGILNGHRVHLVGTTTGLGGLGGVNVVTSISTARWLANEPPTKDAVTYLLLSLNRHAENAQKVRAELKRRLGPRVDVWTALQFARMTMIYWLFDTGAGLGIIFLTLIIIVVGIAITSQTLMATVSHSLREFATLKALGVSSRSLRRIVLEQSGWLGGIGIVISGLAGSALLYFAQQQGVPVALSPLITLVLLLIVIGITLLSGLLAIRTLRNADPAALLR